MDDKGKRILVVEDDPGLRFTISDALEEAGFAVVIMDNGTAAIERLRAEPFDVVLTDLRLPGAGGLEVLKAARAASPSPAVITMTAYGSISSAVEAMKLGAEDYLTKPFAMEEVLVLVGKVLRVRLLEEENRALRKRIASQFRFEELVGKSGAMRKVFDLIAMAAETDVTVLILGESGTGKELVARALHRRGKRKDGPFVALNCSAIPESLFETELFGHERGAFTGAERRRQGRIEQADRGTLFLDEIAEMPLSAQVKLLRVLQERSFTRVGGHEGVDVDIRIVAATNRDDLKAMIEEGTFREDLFYRLNVFAIRLPPLRDRREDIPLLVDHFLAEPGAEPPCRVTESAMARLLDYRFPGNVRELWNIIERATILCRQGAIGLEHLPPEVSGAQKEPALEAPFPEEIIPLKEAVRRFERNYIRRALLSVAGSRSRASGLLGIGRKALWEKLKEG